MTNPWAWLKRHYCTRRDEREAQRYGEDVVKLTEKLLQLRWEADRLQLKQLTQEIDSALTGYLEAQARDDTTRPHRAAA